MILIYFKYPISKEIGEGVIQWVFFGGGGQKFSSNKKKTGPVT